MKAWKEDLAAAVVKEAEGSRIVQLKDIAGAAGIRHIQTQDAMEIMRAAAKRVPGYRLVRMMSTPLDSLFRSVALVDSELEFDDGEEYTACREGE